MDTNKMREQFESAIAEEAGQSLTAIQLSRKDDSYSTSPLIYAWWAWQASREAVVVDIEPDEPADEGAAYLHEDFVRSRIEAQGLKVTP